MSRSRSCGCRVRLRGQDFTISCNDRARIFLSMRFALSSLTLSTTHIATTQKCRHIHVTLTHRSCHNTFSPLSYPSQPTVRSLHVTHESRHTHIHTGGDRLHTPILPHTVCVHRRRYRYYAANRQHTRPHERSLMHVSLLSGSHATKRLREFYACLCGASGAPMDIGKVYIAQRQPA